MKPPLTAGIQQGSDKVTVYRNGSSTVIGMVDLDLRDAERLLYDLQVAVNSLRGISKPKRRKIFGRR